MTLPLIVLLPLFAGTLAALIARRWGHTAPAWAAGGVTAVALALLITAAPPVFEGHTTVASWPWLPEIGLNLSFRLDGLAFMFALLILGIGLLIILYASYYLSHEESTGKFFALLMLFMASMLGIVLSENVLLMVVFWELTSLSSFLLIGFWSDKADSRQGARMALATTGAGGLALLAGFLMLGSFAGTYELSGLFAARDTIQAHPYFPLALILILLGAFTKSAQFPFHYWLPAAMAAPTPVSAYLHSATMVKAGVFLLARMHPVLGGTLLFEYIVTTAGLVTLVFAAYVAIFKHDLKGLLAYSTVSHLGLITFLIGLNTPLSAVAAVFHIINHATFKASLFMAAGIIDHETGSRDMRKLSGLWRYMPYTATLAMVAAAAMAGVPLFNGFISKEMFFAEALELQHMSLIGPIAPIAVTFGGLFSVAYSTRFIHDVFFDGEPRDLPHTPHEPPRYMKVPVEVLVALCIAVGLFPALIVGGLVDVAAESVYGAPLPPYGITVWHGFNLPLLMSAIALVGGVGMYALLRHRWNLHLHAPAGLAARLVFQHAYDGLVLYGARTTAAFQNGSLQRYLAFMGVLLVAFGLWTFIQYGYTAGGAPLSRATPLALIVWGATIIAALAGVLLHRDRLVAVILVGVVGLTASLAFAYFSAPDLALTQISVDVVTTVLLLMALALLPKTSPAESGPGRKLRDTLLALAAGLGVAAVSWAALTREHRTISWYFLENSVPLGGGSNVVNVILVDFRGFDTFGEIIVLGVAAIGAWMLMEGVRVARPPAYPDPRLRNPFMLAVAARVLLPFALLVATYIFLRGHNLPGGGFIAGLVASLALLMQYLGSGFGATDRRIRIDFGKAIGIGVLIAGLTGVAAWFFGRAWLASGYMYLSVPLVGDIPLSSAVAFDVGVFLTVVGSTMLMLTALARAGYDIDAKEVNG